MKRSTIRDSWYNHQSRDKSTAKPSKNYKSTVRGQGRGRDAPSEESSRKDDSSQRYTDESDDATGNGSRREAERRQKNKKGNTRGKDRNGREVADSEPYYAYPRHSKTLKKNKKTQKNLISPTPSFLPPSTRKGFISQIRDRLPTTKLSKVVENNSSERKESPRQLNRTNNNSEDDDLVCFHHHHHHQQHRQGGSPQMTTCNYYEGLNSRGIKSQEYTIQPSNGTVDGEKYSKNFITDVRTTEFYEKDIKESGSDRCYECSTWDENCKNALSAEKEIALHDPYPQNCHRSEPSPNKTLGSKTKEKLVYVVEEDGAIPTKMETDLFTVNEILTIKKDLLELSEFAKKLKKLKEKKKESDRAKRGGNVCHCRPASELLEDVNKRIEALEARQEELEKSGGKEKKLGSLSLDSNEKKSSFKASINSPKKCSEIEKNSVLETIPTKKCSVITSENPTISKPEIIVSRAEGFSNNSEIVCELMDIKSQLQKLEKRKMSKEITSQVMQPSDPEAGKKKNHAIAVFSSKTYILASPDNFRRKPDENHIKSANAKVDVGRPDEKNWKSKTEKTKENVANWLKNSVPDRSNDASNGLGVYVATEIRKDRLKEKENDVHVARCRKCNAEFKEEDYEIQEPKQNRALENAAQDKSESPQKKMGVHLIGPPFSGEKGYQLECKKCLLTNSGRLFTVGRDLKLKNLNEGADPSQNVVTSTLMNLLRHSVSSFSVPSAYVASELLEHPCKKSPSKTSQFSVTFRLEPSRSKSLQELASHLNLDKNEKYMRNTSAKRIALYKISNAKETKESRNKLVKSSGYDNVPLEKKNFEQGDFPMTSSSRSYLVGEINLEKNSELVNGRGKKPDNSINNPQIFSTTAVINPGFEFANCAVVDRNSEASCEKVNARALRRIEKKLQKTGCRTSKEKIYICKVCRKERVMARKKKKKIKKIERCPSPAREKKVRCTVKEIKVPVVCSPRVESKLPCPSTSVKEPEPCVRGRRNCDYHFKSNMFDGSGKHCDCCSKSIKNQCVNAEGPPFEPPVLKQNCSDYSLKDYLKRCQRRMEEKKEEEEEEEMEKCMERKAKYSETTPDNKTKETCGLSNFFKNMRGLYPRCSYLKFFPTLKAPCPKGEQMRPTSEESRKTCESNRRTGVNATMCPQACCQKSYGNRKLFCQQTGTCGKSVDNCKCVQVYLQAQIKNRERELKRKLSDLSNLSSLDEESTKSRHSEKSESNCESLVSATCLRSNDDIFFPYGKSHVYYVGCATEEPHECTKKELKLLKKLKKENDRRKKKEEKAKKKRQKKCVCVVCGNVHKRKKSKKKSKKNKKCHEVTYNDNLCQEVTYDDSLCHEIKPEPIFDNYWSSSSESCSCRESSTVPVFSFLRNFCAKGAKESNKHSSSILQKLNNVRRMKVCSGQSRKPKQTCKCQKIRKNYSDDFLRPPIKRSTAADNKCNCPPLLSSIEERLAALERRYRMAPRPPQIESKLQPQPHECLPSNMTTCCVLPPDNKKKKKKKKNKKNKKKDKCESDSSYIDYDICQENSTPAFYCTCSPKSRHLNMDSVDKTTTTTTTFTTETTSTSTDNSTCTTADTTATSSNINQSSEGSNSKSLGGCKPMSGIRQKLSSIPTFWSRYIRAKEDSKKQKGSKEINASCFEEGKPAKIQADSTILSTMPRVGECTRKTHITPSKKADVKEKKPEKQKTRSRKDKAEKRAKHKF